MDKFESLKRFDSLSSRAFLPLSFFCIAGMGAVSVVNFVDPSGSNGLIEAATVLGVVANLFYHFHHQDHRASSQALVALIGVFLVSTTYTDSAARIGEYWLILFPVIAVLMLGRYVASVFHGLFILSSVPAIILASSRELKYEAAELSAVLFASSVTLLILVFYDHLIDELDSPEVDAEDASDNVTSERLKTEISQRRNAEERLKEAVEELEQNNKKLEQVTAIDEATIASIGEAVLVVDKSGLITRANPSSGRVLGINQQLMVGNPISSNLNFYLQDDESKKLDESEIVINTCMAHRSIREESYIVDGQKPGEKIYIKMTASPLVVAGEVYGAVVVIRDVTVEAVEDKAKSEFVSVASHQLRTPLSTINWYLELVLDGDFGELNKDQADYIREAYEAGNRMGELINALLNVSRLDVGSVMITPKDNVDIRQVIKQTLSDIEKKLIQKRIHVNVSIDDKVRPLRLDEHIMGIILTNLLTNAVKYSLDGSQVSIGVDCDDQNMIISVADQGCGIPKSDQDKIFKKMYRAENAIKNEPDGTGLGLYIIREILDKVDGSIVFKSVENKGSTFTVRIPLSGMKASSGAKQLTVK